MTRHLPLLCLVLFTLVTTGTGSNHWPASQRHRDHHRSLMRSAKTISSPSSALIALRHQVGSVSALKTATKTVLEQKLQVINKELAKLTNPEERALITEYRDLMVAIIEAHEELNQTKVAYTSNSNMTKNLQLREDLVEAEKELALRLDEFRKVHSQLKSFMKKSFSKCWNVAKNNWCWKTGWPLYVNWVGWNMILFAFPTRYLIHRCNGTWAKSVYNKGKAWVEKRSSTLPTTVRMTRRRHKWWSIRGILVWCSSLLILLIVYLMVQWRLSRLDPSDFEREKSESEAASMAATSAVSTELLEESLKKKKKIKQPEAVDKVKVKPAAPAKGADGDDRLKKMHKVKVVKQSLQVTTASLPEATTAKKVEVKKTIKSPKPGTPTVGPLKLPNATGQVGPSKPVLQTRKLPKGSPAK